MITIGYGDIHPYTREEQLYAIFAIILASGVFGYAMNSIMAIFDYSTPESIDLKAKHNYLKKYMKEKILPFQMQDRIKNYLEWLTESE